MFFEKESIILVIWTQESQSVRRYQSSRGRVPLNSAWYSTESWKFSNSQWGAENQQHGLSPEISDHWTPAQPQRFLRDCNNNQLILQASRGEKRSYNEMMDGDDEPVQIGRGPDERLFNIKSVTQVNIKSLERPV